MQKVEAYLGQRLMRRRQASRFARMEQVLIGLGCATTVSDGSVVPTNAGILFFGRNPQQHVIQSEVVCVLFRDATGSRRYADRKIIVGTLQELIDGAEDFLNKYIAVGAKIEGWKRIDLPEYPIEALREALVNAVVHRDYSRRGESIRVFYYEDRIEVHSPGVLLSEITVAQMEQGDVPSRLRNPVLAGLLRDVPGYMERIGSGIRFMHDETRRLGLPAPRFRERMGEFIVTFHKAAMEPVSQSRYEGSLWSGYAQQLEQPVESTANEVGILNEQEDRLKIVMQIVHSNGFVTNRIYREKIGITEKVAFRDLELLVNRGSLKRIGKNRGRRYELP